MKYIIMYHDGNGLIKKKDVKVVDMTPTELEGFLAMEEDITCCIPISYINKRAILKHLPLYKDCGECDAYLQGMMQTA